MKMSHRLFYNFIINTVTRRILNISQLISDFTFCLCTKSITNYLQKFGSFPYQLFGFFFQQAVGNIKNVEIGPEVWIFAIKMGFESAKICLCLFYLN